MEKSFIKNVLKIITGDLIVKIIGFLSIAVIARLYSPQDFGVLELAISIQLIALTFSSLKYDQAILLPKKDTEAFNLLILSLIILLMFSTLSFIACFAIDVFTCHNGSHMQMGTLLYFIPLLILLRGVKDSASFWFSRKKRFGRTALSEVFNKLGEVVLKICLSSIGVYGLFIGNAGGLAASIIVLAYFVFRMDFPLLKIDTFGSFKKLVLSYRNFPLYLLPSHFFKMMSERLPAIVLTPFFSFEIVGYYALSFKLFNEPMSILGKSIANVFYQEASKRHAEDKPIKELIEQVLEKLIVLSFVPICFLAIGGELFFAVFLGENWIEAGYYTQLLAPMMFFRFISTPLAYILTIIGKQHLDMIFSVVLFTISLSSLIGGSIIHNISLTLGLFSIASSFVFIVLIIIIIKTCSISIINIIKKITTQLLIGSPFIFLLCIYKCYITNRYIFFITSAITIALYYLVVFLYYYKKGETVLLVN